MNMRPRQQWVPGHRLLLLILALVPPSLALSFRPEWSPYFVALALLLLLFCVLDAVRLMRTPIPEVQRQLEENLPVAVWRRVELCIENRHSRAVQCQVFDGYPPAFQLSSESTSGLPQTLRLAARHQQETGGQRLVYQIKARQRGDFEFAFCDVLLHSPWSFWQRRSRIPVLSRVKVYPNFAELSVYLMLAQQQRLDQLGIHQFSRRGQGGDFHQLRDYRGGDALRQVDWKATSRYRRLISREYQEDRDQQLLLLLDCGRRMRHNGAGRGHLDDALDAMLLLAFSALRQGDAVGMMSFGAQQRWFAPRKGAATLNGLLNAVYDLQAEAVATDYMAMAQQVLQRQRRRSLIVLLTNTRDEDYRELLAAAQLMRRRHLVVIADLRETLLDETLRTPPSNIEGALKFYATDDYLAARRQAHLELGHQGVHMLDVLPQQLAAALVNEYQRLKRSGQLAV